MREVLDKISSIFDHLSTQSRIWLVFLVIFSGVIFLILVLVKYTLVDHEFYKNLADRQQLRKVELAVNRGTIYASIDPHRIQAEDTSSLSTILATTSITQDLQIDPSASCNLDMLETFLLDIMYQHLCVGRSQVSCFDNVLKYTYTYTPPANFVFTKEYIMQFIAPTVKEQSHRVYKTRIPLAETQTPQVLNAVLALQNPGISVIGESVYVDPNLFDRTKGVEDLIRILAITPKALDDALEPRINRNVNIAEKLDSELSLVITNRIAAEAALAKQQLLKDQDEFLKNNTIYKCIKLTDHPVREYPTGSIAAQVTGFVDKEDIGRLGIEGYFNDLLAGKSGKKDERRDSLGRPIFDEDAEQEVKGVDLYLTIDLNVQTAVMKALEEGVRFTGANSASAIVMDPKTGAIRAVASYPSFDPERPGNVDKIVKFIPADHPNPIQFLLGKTLFVESPSGNVKKAFENRLVTLLEIQDEDQMIEALANPNNILYIYENNIGLAAHQNMAITSPYEPGSIFKSITAAIGLDAGEIEPDTVYEDRGKVQIDEFQISNLDNSKCQGWHTFRNAINYSCNVGMIDIVQRVGRPLFADYLQKFGLGDITGISMDGEHTGTLGSHEKWAKARLFTMTFGQGIQVNLVQMAAAYSVFANGGIYMQPYVVQKRVYPDGDSVDTEPIPVRRVLSETSAEKIRAMLTESTKQGFAKAGAVPGYTLAGKTGTSQIASSKGGFEKGENGRTNTSYAGFGPSSDPQFVIVVRFDRPRSSQYAEQSSAKTFKEISAFLLQYYGIPPNNK